MTRSAGLFAVSVLLALGPTVYGESPPAKSKVAMVVRLINVERARHDLKPLKTNELLAKAAQSQSDWMAQAGRMDHLRGTQPHTLADFRTSEWHVINRLIRVGYFPFEDIFTPTVTDGREAVATDPQANDIIGENVAYGNKDTGPARFDPTVIVQGWMDSPGHRKAILNKNRFTEIGAGYSTTPNAFNPNQQATAWCVVFAGPKK